MSGDAIVQARGLMFNFLRDRITGHLFAIKDHVETLSPEKKDTAVSISTFAAIMEREQVLREDLAALRNTMGIAAIFIPEQPVTDNKEKGADK